jgi:hypothetical protein
LKSPACSCVSICQTNRCDVSNGTSTVGPDRYVRSNKTLGLTSVFPGAIAPVTLNNGRTIFVADAHRGDEKRFVVRADEKLTDSLLFFS